MRWYSQLLAEQLAIASPYAQQIDETFLRKLYRASPLHDIGKVAIDDAILRKPGRLTTSEFEIIKRHTVIGCDILSRAATDLPSADYLGMAIAIARHHHERFDGAGYPDGLSGQAIPLAARIVSVADVFDALTSDRVYRTAIMPEEALHIIEEGSGSQFDPMLVQAFLVRFDDIRQAWQRFWEKDHGKTKTTNLIGAVANPDAALCTVDHLEYSATEG
jgi:putative two-component system response regulator